MITRRSILFGPLSLALLLAGAAAPAVASRGVAVDLRRVDVTQKLLPGARYTLPPLGVRNPGTERSQYEMTVNRSQELTARPAPASWFHFAPPSFTLNAGADKPVRVSLAVPSDARPGKYEALVGPALVETGTGARIGAAAAARVTFTVEPSTWLDAQWLSIRTFFSAYAPWSYLVPALIAVALALVAGRRRFRFSVRLERR